jgi:hypothetical protein
MTKAETITKFELYMDDTSELSTSEAGDLYDRILYKVSRARPWEKLKKAYSGTASGTTLALPADFQYVVQNANYTESSESAEGPVVFVGPDYTPYKLVSWSDRRQYRDKTNVCWIDPVNEVLEFAVAPATGLAVEYDYLSSPAIPLTTESSWIPTEFDDILYFGMCVDSYIIQQSDKARSYQNENQKMYDASMEDLAYWNSELVQLM